MACRAAGWMSAWPGTAQGDLGLFLRSRRPHCSPSRVAAEVEDLQAHLDRFAAYYNTRRPHRAIGRQTPPAPPESKPPPAGPQIPIPAGPQLPATAATSQAMMS
jgi:hypothetical protein